MKAPLHMLFVAATAAIATTLVVGDAEAIPAFARKHKPR